VVVVQELVQVVVVQEEVREDQEINLEITVLAMEMDLHLGLVEEEVTAIVFNSMKNRNNSIIIIIKETTTNNVHLYKDRNPLKQVKMI
jgi:hypothetical protein